MSSTSIITTLGLSILLVYGLTRILEFYGIGINNYGPYISFYFFLLLSSIILPREYYKLNMTNV